MTDSMLEKRIREVLQWRASSVVVPPPDPGSVLTSRIQPPQGHTGQARKRFVLLTVIALVAVAAGGAAFLWASAGTVANGPATESTSVTVVNEPAIESTAAPEIDRPFDFDTQVGVRLQAAELTVDTGARIYSPTGDEVTASGDPGSPPTGNERGYTTLELTWFEHDVEMRINLYFASDGTDWWVTEIRTYDGADPGEWITMLGEYVRTPVGQPFLGDLDAGPLHIGGAVLGGFLPRLSSCDGSGRPGQLLLELSGARPVAGAITPGVTASYATTVALLDASTCEPTEPENVQFRAAVTDPDVATADHEDLTFDPSRPPGQLYVSVTFTGVGETALIVEAFNQQTGDIVASVDIPVTVTDGS